MRREGDLGVWRRVKGVGGREREGVAGDGDLLGRRIDPHHALGGGVPRGFRRGHVDGDPGSVRSLGDDLVVGHRGRVALAFDDNPVGDGHRLRAAVGAPGCSKVALDAVGIGLLG